MTIATEVAPPCDCLPPPFLRERASGGMPELDVPESADHDETRALVREFVEEGDEVEIYDTVMVKGEQNRLEGTVVGLEAEFVVLDTGSVSNERVQYADMDRMTVVS